MPQLSQLLEQYNQLQDSLLGVFGAESKKKGEIIPFLGKMKDLLVQSELDNATLKGRLQAMAEATRSRSAANTQRRKESRPRTRTPAQHPAGGPSADKTSKSYADVAKSGEQRLQKPRAPAKTKQPMKERSSSNVRMGTLVLHSTEQGRTGIQIREQLAKSVNPSELGITVKKTFPAKNQLIVKLPSHEQAAKLADHLQQSAAVLGLQIRDASRRMAPFLIFNVPEEETEESLLAAIEVQLGRPTTEVKIRTKLQGPESTKHWILVAPREVTAQMIKSSRICIGFHSCLVRRYLTIQRCFQCQRIGHQKAECTFPARCVECGGEHSVEKCTETKSCINCARHNRMNGTSWDLGHPASHHGCKAFKAALTAKQKGQEWVSPTLEEDVPVPSKTRGPKRVLSDDEDQEIDSRKRKEGLIEIPSNPPSIEGIFHNSEDEDEVEMG